MIIDVIIPAYNEEKSIGHVVQELPKSLIRNVLVCNNGSSDRTAFVAKDNGAIVIDVPQKGYGNACLAGIDYVKKGLIKPDIIVFVDGDLSDYPGELPKLIGPIISNSADLAIGSRVLGNLEKGAMMPQQIFGNWLATSLIKLIYKVTFTDLGPFRAIRWNTLELLDMQDRDFGWTVEMQVKAAKAKVRCAEVAVNYRRRIGVSKVSGTVKGTVMAGYKILWTIFKLI